MANPTQAELEILNILWDNGDLRVQEVHEKLNRVRPIGYTTTLKAMQVMAQKGLLTRRLDGRSHIYSPTVQENTTKKNLLNSFIDATFRGSRSQLVMQLLGNSEVTREEIDEIKAYLQRLEDN